MPLTLLDFILVAIMLVSGLLALMRGFTREVLSLVADGCSNREIGELLSLSEETIKARVKTILSKLGARDRTHAVVIALQRGLIRL